MPNFSAYIASRPPTPRFNLGAIKHADVNLLAHMAITVCAQTYDRSGQLRSRDACFRTTVDYVAENLWPHTNVVPLGLRNRSVFLGQGVYGLGSFRRWVGDLHGLVLAQRLADGVAGRRGKSANSWAKKICVDAEAHLHAIIAVVARRGQQNPAYAPLLFELQQLQSELF